MSKMVLDESLRSKLNNFQERIELCDESGRTLGHFLPAKSYERLLFGWANAQITDVELKRRLQEPGGNTIEAIWEKLNES